MQKNEAVEMLREFGSNKTAVEQKRPELRDWRWAEGALRFPEGRCCYCHAPVRSNRLWLVEYSRLMGQMLLTDGKAVWESPNHPHSGTDGGLCLGNTPDVLSALFFSINPGDMIRRDMNLRAWYAEMFGHKCKEGEQLKTGIFVRVPRPDRCHCGCRCVPARGPCGCGCPECYCDMVSCGQCGAEITFGQSRSLIAGGRRVRHCPTCVPDCHWCGAYRAIGAEGWMEVNGQYYCPPHKDRHEIDIAEDDGEDEDDEDDPF